MHNSTSQRPDLHLRCRRHSPGFNLSSWYRWAWFGVALLCLVALSCWRETLLIWIGEHELEPLYRNQFYVAGSPQDLGARRLTMLTNRAYVLAYDEVAGNPLWVAYSLYSDPAIAGVSAEHYRRTRFRTDKRTDAQVSEKLYKHSGYQRGHLVPSYAIGRLFGEEAQAETFLMSNISPQKSALNQGPWAELEQYVFEEQLGRAQQLWILSGPVYDAHRPARYLQGTDTRIPDAFFKVVVDLHPKQHTITAEAYLMPQYIDTNSAPLRDYRVTIDEIEQSTALDFFAALDEGAEQQLEGKKHTATLSAAEFEKILQ